MGTDRNREIATDLFHHFAEASELVPVAESAAHMFIDILGGGTRGTPAPADELMSSIHVDDPDPKSPV